MIHKSLMIGQTTILLREAKRVEELQDRLFTENDEKVLGNGDVAELDGSQY